MVGLMFHSVCLAVTLDKKDNVLTVKNSSYTLRFEKGNAFVPRFIQIAGKGLDWTVFTPKIMLNRETGTFREKYNSNDYVISRGAMNLTPETVELSPDKIVLRFTGSSSGAVVTEEYVFDNTPFIRCDISIRSGDVYLSRFEFTGSLNLRDSGGIFYPDRKRVQGAWMENGSFTEGPCWKYAWFESSRVGFGLIACPAKETSGIEYCMQNRKEGWSSDYAMVRSVYSPLRKYGKNVLFQFCNWIAAGGTPEQMQIFAENILGKKEKPFLFSVETEKLLVRPGGKNRVFADLRNPGTAPETLAISLFLNHGLDQEQLIAEKQITLKPGEQKIEEFSVDYGKNIKYGVSFRAELRDKNGVLLDSKQDVSSVSDFAPRDSAFAIINPDMTHQKGSHDAWNNGFKKNYIGVFGYYSWPSSVIYGLAPEADSWIPHTATNYGSTVTKEFLKQLIRSAHAKGIHAYSWLSSGINHKVAYQHPDWLLYTPDGQPNIYVGNFRRNGERRAVVKASIFTPERAELWGNEFADSVDMFGWDGCYSGYSFLPAPPEQGDWYEYSGKSRAELYPDPEKSGVRSLNAWKNAVLKRHPEFVAGTGFPSDEVQKNYPEYAKALCRNSIVLMGDMISGYLDKYKMFGAWTSELSRRDNEVRKQNGTSAMGAITVVPRHSASYHLANYAAASSGLKCWGANGQQIGERSGERNRYLMRYAEYYFGHDFLLPESMPVELISGGDLLFEPFIRQRRIRGVTEIVVPMVNVGSNEAVSIYREEPAPRKNLSFRIKDSKGAEAWIMTPQNTGKAVKLEVKEGIVTVPVLRDAALLLIRYGK